MDCAKEGFYLNKKYPAILKTSVSSKYCISYFISMLFRDYRKIRYVYFIELLVLQIFH